MVFYNFIIVTEKHFATLILIILVQVSVTGCVLFLGKFLINRVNLTIPNIEDLPPFG